MFLPPPSQSGHLSDDGAVAVPRSPLPLAGQDATRWCSSSPDWKPRVFLSSLDSRPSLFPFTHFVAWKHYFLRTFLTLPPHKQFPFHPFCTPLCRANWTVFWHPLSSRCCVRRNHGQAHRDSGGDESLLCLKLCVLGFFALHTSILPRGGTLKSATRCQRPNWEVCCFFCFCF